MRPALVVAALLGLGAAALAGCGGAPVAPPARAPLGVQSNEAPFEPVTLRVRPDVGAAFMTALEVQARAELLGRPMTFDHRLVSRREVLERRPDRTSVLAQRTVSGSTEIGMGDRPPRIESISPEASPRSSVMDERGRTIEDAMFAAPEAAGGSGESLRRIVEPLLDALAYPEEPLALGQSWSSRDSLPLREAGASGRIDHHLVQTLARVEGSGASRLAVIAIRGEVRAEGTLDGGEASGTLRVEGAYTVSLLDGLVRGMEVRVDGEVELGGLRVPIEGTLRYRAEPAR